MCCNPAFTICQPVDLHPSQGTAQLTAAITSYQVGHRRGSMVASRPTLTASCQGTVWPSPPAIWPHSWAEPK